MKRSSISSDLLFRTSLAPSSWEESRFLNPLYHRIWELMIELNPELGAVIVTNGTVLNDKTRELIWKLRPTLSISCDSLDPEVYESIRVGASYPKMRENLEQFIRLARATGKALYILACPMTTNWKTIPELFRFCNERQIGLEFNTVIWPPSLSPRSLSPTQLSEMIAFLEQACRPELARDESGWIRSNLQRYQDMLKQLRLWSR